MVALEVRSAQSFPVSPTLDKSSLSIVQAAYQLDGDDSSWLAGIARSVRATLDRGEGVYAFFWELAPDRSGLRVESPIFIGTPPNYFDVLVKATQSCSPELMAAAYRSACSSLSAAHASLEAGPFHQDEAARVVYEATGVRDQLCFHAMNSPHRGVAVALPSRSSSPSRDAQPGSCRGWRGTSSPRDACARPCRPRACSTSKPCCNRVARACTPRARPVSARRIACSAARSATSSRGEALPQPGSRPSGAALESSGQWALVADRLRRPRR